MEPVSKSIHILKAEYVKEAESILLLGLDSDLGVIRTQIHKSDFYYGDRTESQIDCELIKTAELLIGKKLNLVFDSELDEKIKNNVPLKYE